MAILPKNSTRPSTLSDSLVSGAVVMYEHDGAPLLGAIVEFKKNKYIIFNQRGREVEIPPERIFSLRIAINSSLNSRELRQKYLEDLMNQAKLKSQEVSLEEIWTLVHQDSHETTCEELCQLYYGSLEIDKLLPLRIALLGDKIFFKRHRETFQARNSSTIEDLRRAELERRKKLELIDQALTFFAKKINDCNLEIPSIFHDLIDSIVGIAAERREDDPNTIREVREFLALAEQRIGITLSGSPQLRAFTFLKKIGYFGKYINLNLIRHNIPIHFSSSVLNAANELAEKITNQTLLCSSESTRLDLSHLDCFTVDDPVTKDMDDALSLERSENGFILGVHISDVAYLIETASIVDREARRRCTSIYLPDLTINMFPEILSQEVLSLKANTLRPSLSYLFEIDHRYQIVDFKIQRSLVMIKKRMTYDEVDELLMRNQYPWDVLHQIAACSEEVRMTRGATKVNKREVLVALTDEQKIIINEVDEDGPARSLISEFAILANSASALYGVNNKIPLLFRGQESPDQNALQRERDTILNNIPSGPAQDYQMRFGLKKSLVSTHAAPHASLGLKEYCQATSPIRRYYDLCNQRQIVAFLESGQPLYTKYDLEDLLDITDEHMGRAAVVSRESRRLWLLYYLLYSGMSEREVTGTVVRIDLKSPLIELDDIFLVIGAKSSRKLSLGDHVKIKILSVDPAQDIVRAEVV